MSLSARKGRSLPAKRLAEPPGGGELALGALDRPSEDELAKRFLGGGRKQFALVQPSTASRVDLGLDLATSTSRPPMSSTWLRLALRTVLV